MDARLKQVSNTGQQFSARLILLNGHVQGVGFRPFIYRLALEYKLSGWVRNCVGVVEIHVQGKSKQLDLFISDIFERKPPLAKPVLESVRQIETGDYHDFCILPSESQSEADIRVPPDLFLCDDCLQELSDKNNRRYQYPFINCTQCGPRYTLIQRLPYERTNTTMSDFDLCVSCLAEYEDPGNRRFHAEPVACADCGPMLSFKEQGVTTIGNTAAIAKTIGCLRDGKVVAVKGIGGYHLMCDATDTTAVSKLRANKPRPHKPLAVMFPSALDDPFRFLHSSVELTEDDKQVLLQASRPLLLVAKAEQSELCDEIAPGLNEIGIMLPYSPLHHLLLNQFSAPLVVTSANISGEPVLIDNQNVEKRLARVAEAFLHHDRPIERPADDPVYRMIDKRARPIRTGRGTAPIELMLPFTLEQPLLAVGSQMKNTITLAWKNRVVISPHIGEMDTARSLMVFEKTINDLQELYKVNVESIVCDAHPGYSAARWAQVQDLPVNTVYHHHAHASSAYFESETDEAVIAFTWDGVGYGEDGTLWGGEAFYGKPGNWSRVASMRPFYLPGGDLAAREPWRSAVSMCWEAGQVYADVPCKDTLLFDAWQKKIHSPQTTSVGRMFDAAAALTGLRTHVSFEGQGPMELEAACRTLQNYMALELDIKEHLFVTNWQPLLAMLQDEDKSVAERSAVFHLSMAHVLVQQAVAIRDKFDVNKVCLSGGVFQNKVLTEAAIALLSEQAFDVCLPQLIPVNDAGISFGQIIEYGFRKKSTSE